MGDISAAPCMYNAYIKISYICLHNNLDSKESILELSRFCLITQMQIKPVKKTTYINKKENFKHCKISNNCKIILKITPTPQNNNKTRKHESVKHWRIMKMIKKLIKTFLMRMTKVTLLHSIIRQKYVCILYILLQ